jgi:hypothetical protein
MWTTLKNRIYNLVAKLTRKPVCKSEPEPNLHPGSNPSVVKNGTTPATKDKKFDGARMSENRLQALDGTGYRQCYMEKIRQVASDSEPAESNREYWFGRDDDSSSDWPAVTAAKPGIKPGTTSNTRLPASAEQSAGTASGANQQLTQSSSKTPGIIKAIPTRARVTSTQLQAYVESLPKPEE